MSLENRLPGAGAGSATETTLATVATNTNPDANDLGIIGVWNSTGTGTYTDIGGGTQTKTLLSAAYTTQAGDPATSKPSMVGGGLVFSVSGTLNGGDTLTIAVNGTISSLATESKLIVSTDLNRGNVQSEHAITAADLTTHGAINIGCPNVYGFNETRVQCKLGGAPNAGTEVTVRAKRVQLT